MKRTIVLLALALMLIITTTSAFASTNPPLTDKEEAQAAKVAYLKEHLKVLEFDYNQTMVYLKQLDPKSVEAAAAPAAARAPEPSK
jgi:outer membrane lipoprotein-sorting protein